MRSPTRLLTLAAALLLAPLACRGSITADPNAALREAEVGLAQAVAAARDRVPQGAVVEAEFEVGREGPVYEVEVLFGEEVYEFHVSPTDGSVTGHELERGAEELDEARAALAILREAEVDFIAAIEAAERELGGRAYEAEITADGYVVAVLSEQGYRAAVIDFNNAALLGIRELEAGPEVEGRDDPDDPALDERDAS